MDSSKFSSIIYTGPIDQYFHDRGLDKLEYRSIDFHMKRYFNMNFYQPSFLVTHPDPAIPYTRTVEYKHLLNQQSPHTVIVSETSNDHGDPYYPVPSERNMTLYEKYREMAKAEEKNNVFFVGRLANYKYMNMDQAILNALDYFGKIQASLSQKV
jgi:UDP-galactopyranose mutase